MSGPGEGKLLLENAKVFIDNKEIKADVYIHVKGFSLARVTHLDIESEELNKILRPKEGGFFSIHGIEDGIEIKFEKHKVKVIHEYLKEVLSKNEKTRTWVGGKEGGIYIGFKKEQIVKLEKIAREKFGFNF
ncbi:MAG: transferase [Candidatus Aenigmatarchaeota archaeon]